MSSTDGVPLGYRGKRAFDLVGAIIGIVIGAIPVVVVAILVRWKLGSPVLFVQERPGLRGKCFRMFKFRTMTAQRDENGNLLPDELRLTAFGKFLRSSSLDELPELINILMGDMSLVGPRPLLVQYLNLYTAEQARRHEVRPGLTGWAQVHGRNEVNWEDRFAMDVWYVDNMSFWLDLRIVFATIAKVLKRSGISAESQATMAEFRGSKRSVD